MPILEQTLDVNYARLPFVPTETDTVIIHLAAQVDELHFHIPFSLMESMAKKTFLHDVRHLSREMEKKFDSTINVRMFKMKILAPNHLRRFTKNLRHAVTAATYDVVLMIICDNAATAKLVKEDNDYIVIEALFKEMNNHSIVTAKNARKAGETHVHDHYAQGVYLFNYFYVENPTTDFLALWEHTSRWFAEYTKLTNSYLLKCESGDKHFMYINHCQWNSLLNFLPKLICYRTFKTFVLDNFAVNKVIPFPIIYSMVE